MCTPSKVSKLANPVKTNLDDPEESDQQPNLNFVIPQVHPEAPFPYFSQPEVIGCYSLDEMRSFIDSPEHLKFCRMLRGPKEVRFNLDAACTDPSSPQTASEIPQKPERPSENSQLKHLRRWINCHKDVFLSNRPNFVMRRGVLLKILHAPYEDKEDWTLAAMYKNGTIYLRKILKYQTTELWAKDNSNARHKRFTSWGLNFEDFLLSDQPTEEPNPTSPKKGEFNLVLRATLNRRQILYAAELDGVWCSGDSEGHNPKLFPETLNDSRFVELKTTRDFPNGHMTSYFRKAILRKWWCQAFLGRVLEILVGFRNDDGIVRRLEVMKVLQLPRLALDWVPTVCFNFLDRFLHEVEKLVKQDEDIVFVLKFDPKKQKAKDITITVAAEKDSSKLLPDLL